MADACAAGPESSSSGRQKKWRLGKGNGTDYYFMSQISRATTHATHSPSCPALNPTPASGTAPCTTTTHSSAGLA
eukprot:365943-Chlamydomonas_euryale.AAC.9